MNEKEVDLNEIKISSIKKEIEEKEIEKENPSFKIEHSDPRRQSVLFGLVNDYSNPKHIPFKDKLYLTPSEKYKIYGVFPVRMFLDILLVIRVTIDVFILILLIISNRNIVHINNVIQLYQTPYSIWLSLQ